VSRAETLAILQAVFDHKITSETALDKLGELAGPGKPSHSIYVRVRNVMRVGVATTVVDDEHGVALDYQQRPDGTTRLVGVEVLDARGVEIDGEPAEPIKPGSRPTPAPDEPLAEWERELLASIDEHQGQRRARLMKLEGLIYGYGSFYEVREPRFTPWPNDPDGGELRLIMALRKVLPYLSEEGLTLLDGELDPASGYGARP
jgi:hypothetical protein